MTAVHLPLQRPATGPASADAAPAEEPAWSRVLVVAGSRAALAVVLSLVVWAVLPAALGWSPRVIMSGSMLPRIEVGDVVVDRPVDPADLTPGRIITVTDPDHPEKTRTHRFQERDDQGRLVTKGDANEAADSTPVDPDDVLGVAVLRVPYVGLPMTWMAQGRLAPVGIAVTLLLLLGLAATAPLRFAGSQDEDSDDDRDGSAGPPGDDPQTRTDAGLDILVAGASAAEPSHALRRGGRVVSRAGATPAHRRLLGGLGVAVGTVLALALTTQSTYAAMSAATSNPTSSFAAAAVFRDVNYSALVRGDSPQFYWRLDDAAGTRATDQVGNRTASVQGASAAWVAGALLGEPSATALRLDGATLSSDAQTTSGTTFSIELWVRTNNAGGGPLLALTNPAGTSVDRALYLGSDGRARFGRTGAQRAASPSSLVDGEWHHVVWTNANSGAQNSRGRLYVDGQPVASGTVSNASFTGTWDGGRVTWGRTWDGAPAQVFRGDLDEVAVYSDVLTASEVADHYLESGR